MKLVFGRGQVSQLSNEIAPGHRILILSGGGSAEKNGALAAVRQALYGYEVFEFSGIEANPQYDTLMEALPLIKAERIDYLVAVGGGSVIDGTKFIAAAACFEGPGTPWDMVRENGDIKRALPFSTVLTLPAAGSEMNCYSVISNDRTQDKVSFDSPKLYPQCSILDPEYTFSLPPRQTCNGIIDTFSHVLEQYLTYPVDAPLQDRMAEGILQTLIEEGPKVLADPENYAARANLMLCSTLALNDLISVGVPTDWTTHEIGHSLTELYAIDHAGTLAVLFPATMRVLRGGKEAKLLQYAERVWNIAEPDAIKKIDEAILRTETFFKKLGAKTRLGEYALTERDVASITGKIKDKGIAPLGERQDVHLPTVEQILLQSL